MAQTQQVIVKNADGTTSYYAPKIQLTAGGALEDAQEVVWDGTVYSDPSPDTATGGGGTAPTTPAEPDAGTSGVCSRFVDLPRPIIVGHRGGLFPENTLYADDHYAPFVNLGMDADFRLGSGGVILRNHDDTVNRVSAPATGLLSGYTETAFRALTINFPDGVNSSTPASTWSPKPTVKGTTWKDTMDRYGGKRIIAVEPKTLAAANAIIADLNKREAATPGIKDRIIWNAFDQNICVVGAQNNIPTLRNFSGAPDVLACQQAGFAGFIIYTASVNDAMFDAAADAGLMVFVLQVNTQAQMSKYLGVTAKGNPRASGFPTDYPFALLGKTPPSDVSLYGSGGYTGQAPIDTSTSAGGPAPPPASNYPLLGGHAYTEAEWQQMVTDFDRKLTSKRSYGGSTPPSSLTASQFYPDVAANRASYWSVKPNPKTFPGSATEKSAWSAYFDKVPSAHRLNVIVWHEPEQEIARGDFTLAEWGATLNAMADIIHAKGRPNLRIGPCWMGPWTFDSRSNYYTWDWEGVLDFARMDFLGIDPYKINPGEGDLEVILTKNNYGRGDAPASVLPTMHRLASFGGNRSLPVVIAEWGCTQTNFALADKALWIDKACLWFKAWNGNTAPLTIGGVSVKRNKIEGAPYFNIDASQVVDVDVRMTWQLDVGLAPFNTYKKHVLAAAAEQGYVPVA